MQPSFSIYALRFSNLNYQYISPHLLQSNNFICPNPKLIMIRLSINSMSPTGTPKLRPQLRGRIRSTDRPQPPLSLPLHLIPLLFKSALAKLLPFLPRLRQIPPTLGRLEIKRAPMQGIVFDEEAFLEAGGVAWAKGCHVHEVEFKCGDFCALADKSCFWGDGAGSCIFEVCYSEAVNGFSEVEGFGDAAFGDWSCYLNCEFCWYSGWVGRDDGAIFVLELRNEMLRCSQQ
jgi:hypothetical protein